VYLFLYFLYIFFLNKEINTQNKELHPLVTLLQYVSHLYLGPTFFEMSEIIPPHPPYAFVASTDMRRLTTGIRSEKCVVRRFRCCANVIECTYTNLDSIAYYTSRLCGIAYCS